MTKKTAHTDIAIVGASISGLACGHFLKQKNIPNFILVDPDVQTQLLHTPGYITREPWDNYTRYHHNLDPERARLFWEFSSKAYDQTKEFLRQNEVAYTLSDRVRLILSDMELIEAEKAVRLLSDNGFASEWAENYAPHLAISKAQVAAKAAATFKASSFADALLTPLKPQVLAEKALGFTKEGSKVILETEHSKIHCEILVLACDYKIVDFLPDWEDTIIPISDQWDLYETVEAGKKTDYNLYSAFHGYYFGVQTEAESYAVGGARFLRKLAGIGELAHTPNAKVTAHLREKMANLLAVEFGKLKQSFPLIEASSCDELPIIGPLLGNDRILLAACYNKAGLTTGFYAGRILSDLIANGRSDILPEFLKPTRFRNF